MRKIILLIFCWLSLASYAQAGIFWESKFNTQDCNWTGSANSGCLQVESGVMQIDLDMKYEGAGSLMYYFDWPQVGSCDNPWLTGGTQCGGYWDRPIQPSARLWRRFWLRLSPDFVSRAPGTKIVKIGSDGNSDWLGFGANDNDPMQLVMSDQTTPRQLWAFGSLVRGQWQCIETDQQVNTPGVANGTFIMWLNGNLIANYNDVQWRAAGDNSLMNYTRVIRQNGRGTMWMDSYAVGDSRIGCGAAPDSGGGGAPPPDTSPPNAPTNLNVTELWERVKTLVATVWQWLGPAAADAATAASDQVVIRWDPRPGQRFTLDLTGFAWNGAKTFADLDAGIGMLTVPLPGLPPGQPGDDRWLCATERDGKAVTGCNQLALGPIVLPPPPPVPEPEPELIGPAIVTMSGDKVYIACDPARYTKASTTGRGTKRTITCLP